MCIRDSSLSASVLNSITTQIAQIRALGAEVVLVSSGAVAAGRERIPAGTNQDSVANRQTLAAIGQPKLMSTYSDFFAKLDIEIAQALVSHRDMVDRISYLNVRNTLNSLLALKIVPILNENDVVSVDELSGEFSGDNDRLASRVAQISSADCLILLSDVDGLYTDNPKKNKKTKLIETVKKIDENIIKYATKAENLYGSGGMKTKIDAAKICQFSGCYMCIANGLNLRPIKEIIKKNFCTWFLPRLSKLDARKKWIISSISPKGELIIAVSYTHLTLPTKA